MAPAKPRRRRLRMTRKPIASSRGEAPTIATLRGASSRPTGSVTSASALQPLLELHRQRIDPIEPPVVIHEQRDLRVRLIRWQLLGDLFLEEVIGLLVRRAVEQRAREDGLRLGATDNVHEP